MNKAKLSVCLITSNEEGRLGVCLDSLGGLADEIVIVDSQSTDGTEAVAQRFGARFFSHPFDNFGNQKQRAIDLACHTWILFIDADECLTEELRHSILELLQDPVRLEKHQGYQINRLNFFMGKPIRHGGWSPDYLVRLFRKGDAGFSTNLVHESVLVNGSVARLSGDILHYTYTSIDSYVIKNARYARLSALEKRARGVRPSILKLILDPPFVFIRMYLFRQGFRDGREGLFLAILYSFYTALKYLWMFYL